MFLFNSWNLTNWFQRFDLKLTMADQPSGYTSTNNSAQSQTGDKQAVQGGMDSSTKFRQLRYPLDLGDQGHHKHTMLIGIYTQNQGSATNRISNIAKPNKFDDARGGLPQYQGTSTGGTIGAVAVNNAGTIIDAVKSFFGASSNPGDQESVNSAYKKSSAASLLGDAAKLLAGGTAATMTSGLNLGGSTTSTEALGYIALYMPETLNFVSQQDFDAVSMTEAMGLAGLASQAPAGGAEQQLTLAGQTGIYGNTEKYRDAYLQKNLGYALNPQLEILYSGPKNREFVFSFKLTPRSEDEAAAVWSIINVLRFHASPEYYSSTAAARYIVPPSQFDIRFYKYDGSNPVENVFLPRIGPSVLTNVDVNYAPTGKFATFKDGTPVEIQMQLTFTETIILTKADILAGF